MASEAPTNGTSGNPQPWWVASDLDGFFGLVIDNLIQFLLILALCTGVLGFDGDLVLGTILPGAALSILIGNVYYSWQAQKLSAKEGRTDVTALPYGINTVSLFAYVFLVMMPVKMMAMKGGATPEDAAKLAWQVGLAACLVSGVIEFLGSFVAEFIRKHTPRAALLSTLAGIAISFIAIDFAMKTFEAPLVAMLPLGVILTTYFSHARMPFRIPGGAWALILGGGMAWLLYAMGEASPVAAANVTAAADSVGFYLPVPVLGDMLEGLQQPMMMDFLVPIMLPMGLFNILGSLQNIESAEAAGDSYPTAPCLAVNGLGTVVAAAFGSCFPTTIYIGHPGWKELGARSGYSVVNGVFFTFIALFGLTGLVNSIIPMEAGMAIVLWIGIIITAQAFQTVPKEHAPGVAFGLFPAIAGWGVMIIGTTLGAAGTAKGDFGLAAVVLGKPETFVAAGLHIEGLVALSQGFLLSAMIWAAISVHLIDKAFKSAIIWALIGAVCAFFGFIHAGSLTPSGAVYDLGWATGWRWALGYVLCAGFFAFMLWWSGKTNQETATPSA